MPRPRRRPLPRALLLTFAVALGVVFSGPDSAQAQDVEILGSGETEAETHYRQGEKLLKLGKLAAAVAEFDRAAKAAPTFHTAYYAAGNALVRLDRLPEAEERYRNAVAAKPSFAHGWNALGVVLLKKRDNAKALKAFDKAIAKDPALTLARLHRAKALAVLERHVEAEKELRGLLAGKPTHLDARTALAASRLAQGDADEALVLLDEVLLIAKTHGDALVLRVQVLARKGDLLAAAESLGEALELAGKQPNVRAQVGSLAAQLADAAHERGALPAQVRALEVLVTVQPKDARTRTNYGAALLLLWGKSPEAERDPKLLERGLQQLERSLELRPDQPNVRKLLARYRGA